MDDRQIANLKKIGLNEYEARAYASLVGLREATAREILEAGSIPQGRIYDILKVLARKGYVEIQEGSPTYYRAVDPAAVIQSLSTEYTELLQQTMDTLKDLHVEATSRHPVWVIHNESAITNRVLTLLKTVERELIVYSNNPEFFRQFADEFRRVRKHCRVHLIVDDPEKFRLRNLTLRQANEEFFYIMGDFVQEGVTYRNIFSIIVDEKESFDVMMIGNTRVGVVTKLPVISYIIRRWLSRLGLLDDEGS
ncbi:MAG: TrmB family transcriptional regulator [Methanospirillum sp.]